jgi:hypothetical protein
MRSRLPILLGGFVCLLVSVIAAPLRADLSAAASAAQDAAQAQAQQPNTQQPNTLQVGVPNGRQGAPRQGGPGRGRQAGPPQPPPRNADGRVLLGSATPKQRNGVWLPNGGGPVSDTNIKDVPFQPWARGVLADRDENQLEPHTRCKPSGVTRPFLTPYGVEFVELNELERIYIFHRLQRRLLARSPRITSHHAIAHTRALHAYRSQCDQVRSDDRRSRRVHEDVEERLRSPVGSQRRTVRVCVPADELRARADARRTRPRRSPKSDRSVAVLVRLKPDTTYLLCDTH